MNMQKYLISSVAAGVWIFVYGWVVYGFLLAGYTESITPEGTMLAPGEENPVFIALGSLIQGLGLGLIYTRGHEGKGAMEGVRFGLFVGVFLLGMYVLMSGITPYTLQGSISFAVIDTIMYMGAGIAFALLYKK